MFGGVDIGEVPVQAKPGRHSLYWGESLFLGGNLHGIAYCAEPARPAEGLRDAGRRSEGAVPPAEPAVGAGAADRDALGRGAVPARVGVVPLSRGRHLPRPGRLRVQRPGPPVHLGARSASRTAAPPAEPEQRGEWGLAARWSPEWLDGTLGFYYRNFADKLPQTFLTQVGPGISSYNLIYADDIDLFGISLAKNIGGVSVGAEVSYRHNTPLNSQCSASRRACRRKARPRARAATPGTRWSTCVGVIPKTPVFDTASWAAELTWSQLHKVQQRREPVLRASASRPAANGTATADFDKWDGCTTKNYFGIGLAFTPTWFQVFPGVDLSAADHLRARPQRQRATVFGGNEANGNYSVGLGADVQQKYRFDLKYIDYLGHYKRQRHGRHHPERLHHAARRTAASSA